MKSAALALALASSLAIAPAWGAEQAQSPEECSVAADMAIVARSLAQEDIRPEKAQTIMARIYDVAESDRGQRLMQDILDAAYKSRTPGSVFAQELFSTCMKTSGDMDPMLGSGKRL
ncbi:MAG: hypothetical protein JO035_11055 [Betaproteobacteria bacterium]|nr:hypothetical protein [Betaproteobacteria bacterium]